MTKECPAENCRDISGVRRGMKWLFTLLTVLLLAVLGAPFVTYRAVADFQTATVASIAVHDAKIAGQERMNRDTTTFQRDLLEEMKKLALDVRDLKSYLRGKENYDR